MRVKANKYIQPIKAIYGRYVKEMDYKSILKSGYLRIPNSVIFEPTMLCNLNCQMCYQKSNRLRTGRKELSLNEIIRIFDDMPNISYVTLIGGEVFLRRDIFELLEYFSNKKIKVNITTNGTMLDEKKMTSLLKYKNTIGGISFSIDGLEETHDRVRGVQGAYEKVKRAIALTLSDFNVYSNTVIVKENMAQMQEIIETGRALGLKEMSFQFEQFSSPSEIEKTENILGEKDIQFDIEIKEPSEYDYSFNKMERVVEIIKKTAGRMGINVNFTPRPSEGHLYDQYAGTYNKYKLDCQNLYRIRIDSEGNVVLCNYIRKKFGNLKENSINSIWNSEDFKETRKSLLEANLYPVCRRCCKLTIFDDKL